METGVFMFVGIKTVPKCSILSDTNSRIPEYSYENFYHDLYDVNKSNL